MEITRARTLAHPPDAVVALLLDPDAHVATYRHMGHREIEVLRAVPEPEASPHHALEIDIVRRVDVEVPAAARRFVHPTNTVTSRDRWERHPDGTCTGRSDVEIRGLPVTSVGTASVRPDGAGTRYEITLALTIGVPVVGERVARAMRGQLVRQLDAQLDATEALLGIDPPASGI